MSRKQLLKQRIANLRKQLYQMEGELKEAGLPRNFDTLDWGEQQDVLYKERRKLLADPRFLRQISNQLYDLFEVTCNKDVLAEVLEKSPATRKLAAQIGAEGVDSIAVDLEGAALALIGRGMKKGTAPF